MKNNDICFTSACELAEKIKRQEISSQETTEIIIERIKKVNPLINAYCTPTFDLALQMAKKADDNIKKNQKLGLIHGVPLSIKDETETKDIRTTFGCCIFEKNVPMKDEPVVERLKNAGGIVLGKTNTPSFGYKAVTDNLIFGATKNPWNLERTSGGSSGGAAAAVASGLGPLAIGSDGGGSIRIPSSFCGVYGFKPTYGRIPHNTMKLSGYLGTLVHKGPIVRYVKDAALMLDVLVGEDDSDRYSLPKPNFSFLKELEKEPKKLKIGYAYDFGYTKAIDPQVKNMFLDAVQKFESLNWQIEKVKLNVKKAASIMEIFWYSGFAYSLGPFLKQWQAKLEPDLVDIIKQGYKYSTLDIKLAEVQREQIFEVICRQFKKYDLLITPTLACTAFELGKNNPDIIDGIEVSPVEWLYTYPFNLTGHPAASIPCGRSKEGLPVGMQIVGNRFDELTILHASKIFEEISPWQRLRPNLN
jgi:Asp-tRNA(Asn)/Glu-tRNA(Gln) amidotransferase A subunit family amidase